MAKNKKVEISLEEKLEKALVPFEEQPYPIPNNWVWTSWKEIAEIFSARRVLQEDWKDKGIPFYRAREIVKLSINGYVDNELFISEEHYLKLLEISRIPKTNDLMVSAVGTLGSTYVVKSEDKFYYKDASVLCVSPKKDINSYYLKYLMESFYMKEQIKLNSKGSTVDTLTISKYENFHLPLPPLNEQKRIVEKLDFLFEKTKRAKEIIEEIKVDIENRKISILDRAFKGVLTSKWRSENKTSDVRELLKSINDEKIKKWEEDCLQAEKDGNKKPKKPTITEVEDMIIPVDEQPYELPESWVWVRLGDISEKISKGTTPRGDDGYTEEGVNFLRVENIGNNNSINLSNIKYINEKTHNSFLKRSILKEKDILISIAGTLGRTAIVKKEDLPANVNQAISFVRLIDNNKVLENFIILYLNSPIIKSTLLSQVKVTAIPNLTLEIISDIKFPLPPLEEQQEIVRILDEVLENENKVKELLELEERIDVLEKSILNKAFKGELGTQNNSDESAMELLKEILKNEK